MVYNYFTTMAGEGLAKIKEMAAQAAERKAAEERTRAESEALARTEAETARATAEAERAQVEQAIDEKKSALAAVESELQETAGIDLSGLDATERAAADEILADLQKRAADIRAEVATLLKTEVPVAGTEGTQETSADAETKMRIVSEAQALIGDKKWDEQKWENAKPIADEDAGRLFQAHELLTREQGEAYDPSSGVERGLLKNDTTRGKTVELYLQTKMPTVDAAKAQQHAEGHDEEKNIASIAVVTKLARDLYQPLGFAEEVRKYGKDNEQAKKVLETAAAELAKGIKEIQGDMVGFADFESTQDFGGIIARLAEETKKVGGDTRPLLTETKRLLDEYDHQNPNAVRERTQRFQKTMGDQIRIKIDKLIQEAGV